MATKFGGGFVASREEESREYETRDDGVREAEYNYVPPSSLPDPKPRTGWVHRWVRISVLGKADDMNLIQRRREGWEMCKASDYPEMAAIRMHDRTDDIIENGGLVLCRAPEKAMRARDRYYQQMNERAMSSIDNSLMKEQDSRMPLLVERKSKVSFGSGSGG